MKFMILIKASQQSEAGTMPSTELLEAMQRYNEELAAAGVLQAGEGLHPSSAGARVRFAGDRRDVVEGPFENTGELLAGFWIFEVKDRAEAIAWVKKMPAPMPGEETEVELRRIFTAEDFGDALTPELRAREDALRAAA